MYRSNIQRVRVVLAWGISLLLLWAFFPVAWASAYDISTDLVGYWKLDESGGELVLDSSGNGNYGQLKGGTWTTGVLGNAVTFSGSPDRVVVPDSRSLDFEGSATIASWLRATDLSADSVILYKGDSVPRGLSGGDPPPDGERPTGGFVYFYDQGGWQSAGYEGRRFDLGLWYHIAFVYDVPQKKHRLYVNGQLQGEAPFIGQWQPNDAPVTIASSDVGHYFHGTLDDVRLYSRPLSEEDIQALYDYGQGIVTESGEPDDLDLSQQFITLCHTPVGRIHPETMIVHILEGQALIRDGAEVGPCLYEDDGGVDPQEVVNDDWKDLEESLIQYQRTLPEAPQNRIVLPEIVEIEQVPRGESCEYLKEFIRFGYKNDPDEVKKLQQFLNQYQGSGLAVTGVYDEPSYEAVKSFQRAYFSDILWPWSYQEPTGYVYLTTRKKINELYCGTEFPLTAAEIEEVRSFSEWVHGIDLSIGERPVTIIEEKVGGLQKKVVDVITDIALILEERIPTK